MALNQGSSGGVDCVDVKYVLSAFQVLNRCGLVVTIRVFGTESRPVMELEVRADPLESAAAEPVPLGSVRCEIGSSGPRTMEAAILQGLYRLDAILAEGEFARAISK